MSRSAAGLAGGLDEVAEEFADFRRAAGDVHDLGPMLADPCADLVGDLLGHHLGAVRTGIDVAVGADLVALATDVDLEGFKATPGERRLVFSEFLLEVVPGNRSMAQNGNVAEWGESALSGPNESAGEPWLVCGGTWSFGSGDFVSSVRLGEDTPADEAFYLGFRVAAVPEPSGFLLTLIGMMGVVLGRRR